MNQNKNESNAESEELFLNLCSFSIQMESEEDLLKKEAIKKGHNRIPGLTSFQQLLFEAGYRNIFSIEILSLKLIYS